jgi:hypothetical protein
MPPPSASTTKNGTVPPLWSAASWRAIHARRLARRFGPRRGCASGSVRTAWLSFHRLKTTAVTRSAVKDRQVKAHAEIVERARHRDPARRREQHDRGRAQGRRHLLHPEHHEVEEQNRREDGADEDRAREEAELPQVERGVVLLVDMRQVEELELELPVGGARQRAPHETTIEERERARAHQKP